MFALLETIYVISCITLRGKHLREAATTELRNSRLTAQQAKNQARELKISTESRVFERMILTKQRKEMQFH